MPEEEPNVKVSNILNETGAYNRIARALRVIVNCDSTIFHEIEEYIVEKYLEMDNEEKEAENEY